MSGTPHLHARERARGPARTHQGERDGERRHERERRDGALAEHGVHQLRVRLGGGEGVGDEDGDEVQDDDEKEERAQVAAQERVAHGVQVGILAILARLAPRALQQVRHHHDHRHLHGQAEDEGGQERPEAGVVQLHGQAQNPGAQNRRHGHEEHHHRLRPRQHLVRRAPPPFPQHADHVHRARAPPRREQGSGRQVGPRDGAGGPRDGDRGCCELRRRLFDDSDDGSGLLD